MHGTERRSFATIEGPSSTASHPTWRLRRPGNGFILLKAKGTAGVSILFSTDPPPRRGGGDEAWPTGDHYEVRLGQRGNEAAGGGYIAKHSAGGGLQLLAQSAPSDADGSVQQPAVIGEKTPEGYTGVWVATVTSQAIKTIYDRTSFSEIACDSRWATAGWWASAASCFSARFCEAWTRPRRGSARRSSTSSTSAAAAVLVVLISSNSNSPLFCHL